VGGRQVQPHECTNIVLCNAVTEVVHHAEAMLRLGVSLLRRRGAGRIRRVKILYRCGSNALVNQGSDCTAATVEVIALTVVRDCIAKTLSVDQPIERIIPAGGQQENAERTEKEKAETLRSCGCLLTVFVTIPLVLLVLLASC